MSKIQIFLPLPPVTKVDIQYFVYRQTMRYFNPKLKETNII